MLYMYTRMGYATMGYATMSYATMGYATRVGYTHLHVFSYVQWHRRL